MLGEYRIEGRRASEIAASVERGVSAGELSPGQVLPPLRELAVYLEVNPNTVAAAYRTLRDRGVIETRGRLGSRIRERPASTSRDAPRVPVPPGVRDLSHGNPDPALLPDLGPALAAAAGRSAAAPTLYGAPPVSEGLAAAAREAFEADGVPGDHLAVTSGSLEGIERVLAAHLRPGDSVAVEDPGWRNLLDLVPTLGLRVAPVAVDQEGPLPEELQQTLAAGARAVIVTARAQNPTGAAVSEARAARLRAVLGAHPQVLLVEDDHGHDNVSLPLHPLGGAGATDHWVVVRSVAKAYGPDLRLAVLSGDAVTMERVRGRQRLGPGWVSHLLQDAVAHLWRTGRRDRREVVAAYDSRRTALLDALAERGVPAGGSSGLNVWVPVPDETTAVAGLLRAGWAVAPGARFRIRTPQAVRVTVSSLPKDEAPAVADAVAAAIGGAHEEGRRYD
ncbi:aminotransferase class I/II-fold pyridoxal phosphate-dependent enzyme [Streptomyces sp. NPDC059740]|uniref:aminotransferase class I/II-fold pyridoxal phosphate-dependent enzyme n=1 Tax=Streptomyces sp. NPDC059740 TaxID=3346926 RepID=UPI00366477FA